VREILLGPLSETSALQLVRALAHSNVSDEALSALIRDAEGKPLFVCMLARYGIPGGASLALYIDSSDALLSGTKPTRLHELLTSVVAQLPAASRSLLELSAIAGRPLGPEILRRAADHTDGAGNWPEPLSLLQGVGLLRSIRTPHGHALECSHDRVCEVVAAEVDAEQRPCRHLGPRRIL